MSDRVSIALVGIGGYGNNFVTALLDAPHPESFRFAGTIDPSPTTCRRLGELKARNIPLYPNLEAFFEKDRADLVIVSTPLHLHARHTCYALEHGASVLCEKPLCVTLEQAKQMRETRDRMQKHVAIGYQWSFSEAIQRLKADVMSGALGKPKRLKCLVLWPRDEAYYARNKWAVAKQDPNGNLVLDSPVNNACAHYLHNMLYVLGERVSASAAPAQLSAELYRAHKIQNYDTAAMRCRMRDGVELLFIVSHCTAMQRGPIFSYEFEKGTVDFADETGATIVARFHDGTHDYGSPAEGRDRKIWMTVDAMQKGRESICGIEASEPHTQCVLAAQESTPNINVFDPASIRITGDPGHRKTIVNGLGEALIECYEKWKLPSELGLAWAKPPRSIGLTGAAG